MARMFKAAVVTIIFILGATPAVEAGALEDAIVATHKGDYALALELLRPLAENGNPRAEFNVGYLYANGWGVRRDYSEALNWYRKAADQRLSIAQYYLGLAYANGDGVWQNDTEAVRLYRLAAEQGFPFAQLNLGLAYANGRGVPRDLVVAYAWISLSGASKVQIEIARSMSPAQIAEARRLASEWKQSVTLDYQVWESESKVLLGYDRHFGEFANPLIWPISAVGMVTVAGRSFCTGTLVAPTLVLTAAHCLFFGQQAASPGSVRFLVGLNRGVPSESSIAKRLVISKEFNEWTPAGSATDWAVIILKDVLSARPVSIKSINSEQFSAVSKSGTVSQVGYGMERTYSPSIVRDCRVSEAPDKRVFFFRCLTNFGYSGSPIFADIDGTPSVIGIASGGSSAETRGIACSAAQFEKTVTDLMQSE